MVKRLTLAFQESRQKSSNTTSRYIFNNGRLCPGQSNTTFLKDFKQQGKATKALPAKSSCKISCVKNLSTDFPKRISSGPRQASGQISQGSEHRRSLPVVCQYWTEKMSPFHQRYIISSWLSPLTAPWLHSKGMPCQLDLSLLPIK